MYIPVRVLLDCLQVVFFVILVVELNNVAVGIESRRVSLQDGSFVSGVDDLLRQ